MKKALAISPAVLAAILCRVSIGRAGEIEDGFNLGGAS